MADKKVTIIGLGLIGGSLARALHDRMGMTNILAVDRDIHSIRNAAKEQSIKDGFIDIDDSIYDSDLIFICTPVKSTVDYYDRLCHKVKPGCIITDVGSTKAEIIEHVNAHSCPSVFIGGHPMAGTEKSGYSSSFSSLFENAYYILCPSKSSDEKSLGILNEIIKGIGAIPVMLDAHEHDKITGCISHVPHIIASALVNTAKQMDAEHSKLQLLAAGGFKDITRIASSNPEMWESIVLSNKHHIEVILDRYIEIVNNFKELIKNDAYSDISNFFKSAKDFRDKFKNN